MDADGLPLVGPGVDYNKIEAINQKRTIAFINHFITHTSRFLNRFANVCEEKLESLTERLQQLEISLSILEAKLSSIPGLEAVTVPQSAETTSVTTSAMTSATNTSSSSSVPPPPAPTAPVAQTPAQALPEPPPTTEEIKSNNPVSQDPRYMKYFKMLQYGVPPPVIKGKMGMDGLNPDLLDTPDAPAPDGGAATSKEDSGSESDSDASFSD